MRLWPRNLAGQLAFLVAIALFVAQAINFALLLNERRQFRIEQITGPVAARIIDAIQNQPDDDPTSIPGPPGSRIDRGRAVLLPYNPIAASLERRSDVEERLKRSLREAGLTSGAIVAGVHMLDRNDPRLQRMSRYRSERFRMAGAELLVAVEQPRRGWIVTNVPWQQSDGPIIWRLIAQTLILYGVVLLPVLWIGRRISRPLHASDAQLG